MTHLEGQIKKLKRKEDVIQGRITKLQKIEKKEARKKRMAHARILA